ncbi:hypothetical protein D3C81_2096720 [compost metagenome]
MLHFADGFFVLVLAQLVEAPMVQHAGMQKILVDGRQFVGQLLVQELDDGFVAFHNGLLAVRRDANASRQRSARCRAYATPADYHQPEGRA